MQLTEWHINSTEQLRSISELENNPSNEDSSNYFEKEIQIRNFLKHKYEEIFSQTDSNEFEFNLFQILGTWEVVGYHPDIPNKPYIGKLFIEQSGSHLIGSWLIGEEKIIHCLGVFRNNFVAFNYREGVVLYELIAPDIMRLPVTHKYPWIA